MNLLTFAFNSDNKLVHINNVKTGAACNCTCPYCNNPIIAKNEVNIRQHHFAHIDNQNCSKAYETTLHILAKDILKKGKCLSLPEGRKAIFVDFIEVELEKPYPNCRQTADAVCKTEDGRTFYVEFFVNHRVDAKKATMIVESSLDVIQINLNNQGMDEDRLRSFIIGSNKNREYIDEKYLNSRKRKKIHNVNYPTEDFIINYLCDRYKEVGLTIRIGGRNGKKLSFEERKDLKLCYMGYDLITRNKDIGAFHSDLYISRSSGEAPAYAIIIGDERRRLSGNRNIPQGVIAIYISMPASITEESVKYTYSTGLIDVDVKEDNWYFNMISSHVPQIEDDVPF